MNQRHPSEYSSDYDAHAYDAYSSGSYPTLGTTYADDTTGSHAYGHIPQQAAPYDQQYAYGYDQGTAQQGYDQSGYDTGSYATGTYATGTYETGSYETGGYATGTYDTGGYAVHDPYAATATTTGTGATYYDTGTYDTTAWQTPQQPAFPQQQEWDSGAYPTYGYGYGYDSNGDTGLYEQVSVPFEATGSTGTAEAYDTPPGGYPGAEYASGYGEPEAGTATATGTTPFAAPVAPEPEPDDTALLGEEYTFGTPADDEPVRHEFAVDEVPTARSRRRKPAKRSALLTVGVPSVAVMGVAAVGAAAVGGVGMAQGTSKSTTDASGKAPTTQLDRQLSGVSQDADDFATRASRSQERVDLKDRQAAAKKAAAEAAARKEALRPKFVLPVKQKGLSAYFGQSGEHWMALHTGIDFPVQVGTPVMAVTDGTVRTQWNSSYGNMAIVTAPDGTETWYCHLSSTKIRSGTVKAGTVIAYSGNTGNTTGPHLHLEVRPHGGSPIDPLPWLLSHGLDPR
ncbi:Murein DD-endopeptidase MepM and murein hydrolase activator NlpD, contain LysM domain [Actinacidiphila yanglinensis]|uniref:Murein DD-endopeptidase MepM and murein hydrolase activator NlpD, contain LysM domain n=1 Tax=Actinacidiphila yanglinensis TaxID=310779 RepID=A0A1H6BPP3_9ACTN|nr:M23 family metallopeptidase [Actinacidiphila yanglinensis]SEG62671.1 Murein DD-endopeptidase MepM and murein hydrolase activator NlpD, contain LysM domain [Actinacidiphila yanglinensis]